MGPFLNFENLREDSLTEFLNGTYIKMNDVMIMFPPCAQHTLEIEERFFCNANNIVPDV